MEEKKKQEEVFINLITYDESVFSEERIELSQLEDHLNSQAKVIWIDIVGLHDISLLEQIGKLFGIHKLTLEDILSVEQRPKMEVFDEYIFATLKMIQCNSPESPITEEQVSFLMEKKYFNYVSRKSWGCIPICQGEIGGSKKSHSPKRNRLPALCPLGRCD